MGITNTDYVAAFSTCVIRSNLQQAKVTRSIMRQAVGLIHDDEATLQQGAFHYLEKQHVRDGFPS